VLLYRGALRAFHCLPGACGGLPCGCVPCGCAFSVLTACEVFFYELPVSRTFPSLYAVVLPLPYYLLLLTVLRLRLLATTFPFPTCFYHYPYSCLPLPRVPLPCNATAELPYLLPLRSRLPPSCGRFAHGIWLPYYTICFCRRLCGNAALQPVWLCDLLHLLVFRSWWTGLVVFAFRVTYALSTLFDARALYMKGM